MKELPTILIAAGGTGGHITPGISIADAWLRLGGRVVFATLIKDINYPDILRLARNDAVTIVAYDAPRLPRFNPMHWIHFFKRFFSAARLVAQAAHAEKVTAVAGMGGYSTFPAVAFAIWKRIPLFLCEQNARWGIVTRLCRLFARRIFLSFPAQKNLSAKYAVTGNPLRDMFADKPKKTAAKKSGREILFLGGSQGANDINGLYVKFLSTPLSKKFTCTVAAGKTGFEALKPHARKSDTILPFITDMRKAYENADFIIARCGSGTLFEIVWSGKPAFLIPYPFAAANHQRANADAIKDQMPCIIFDERPFNADQACRALVEFLESGTRNQQVGQSAPSSRAEEKITRYIIESLT